MTNWLAPVLMLEGLETGDGRLFENVTWRDLPLPLLWVRETGEGHDGAVIVGHIDTIAREAGGVISASGTFNTTPEAAEVLDLIRGEDLRGVSVDLGDVEDFEVIVRETDADGFPTDVLYKYTGAAIMGATLVPFPAFKDAHVILADGELSITLEQAIELVAACAPAPTAPESNGNGHAPPIQLNVQWPALTINNTPPQVTVPVALSSEHTIQMPEQPAPVVEVAAPQVSVPITVPEPTVTVTRGDTTQTYERDERGLLTATHTRTVEPTVEPDVEP